MRIEVRVWMGEDRSSSRKKMSELDPVMAATLEHVERMAMRTRRPSSRAGSRAGSRGSSCRATKNGSSGKKKAESDESLLPYVPKAYELYVLAALPMIPFMLLILFLAPLLMEE